MVVLGERRAEFAQDDALRQRVEGAVAPKATDDLRRLLGAAHRPRRSRRGDLARARPRWVVGKKCRDLIRRLRMRRQFGFLQLANPRAAWPARMRLEEGGKRVEGRVGVGPQSCPFERRTLIRVSGRRCERHETRGVALPVEDYGLRTSRRRQGGVSRGLRPRGRRRGRFQRGRLHGRRDRRRRPKHGRCAFKARIGELDLGLLVAPRRLG